MSSSFFEWLKQRRRRNSSPEPFKRPPSLEPRQNHNVLLNVAPQELLLSQIDFSSLLLTRDMASDATPSNTETSILDAVLSKYSHLDLTGKVHGITNVSRCRGGCGEIFTGYYSSSGDVELKVAVKRIYVRGDTKFKKRLAKELYIWSQLKHRNILPLEGFYIGDEQYPSLVSEWMESGAVLDYLKAKPETDLLPIVVGIARGIDYLHRNKIVHSDIKPDNVLISSSGMALLTDFGISRMLSTSRTFQFSSTLNGGLKGTFLFMSKELILADDINPATYSKESDVWAFGMTVYTILTKRMPYDNIKVEPQIICAISKGMLPVDPDNINNWPGRNHIIFHLMQSCWRTPVYRPGMNDLLRDLESLEQGYNTIASPRHSDFIVHNNPSDHPYAVALARNLRGAAFT